MVLLYQKPNSQLFYTSWMPLNIHFWSTNNIRQDNTTLFSDTVWQLQRPQAVEITTQQQPRLDEVTVQQQQLQVDEVTMQQQPEVNENIARQQQLRYDNDGVLECYRMLNVLKNRMLMNM